jgi:uncharacterized membrane protein YdjX (TVP38/TMEM64 family)
MKSPRMWLHGGLAVALLALLAWQGGHIAHLLPLIDAKVAALGPWGPIAFVLALALLSPLLFPDSPFGLVAGFVFGLWLGTLYYFGTIYVVNLAIVALGRSRLRARILRLAADRPKAQAILNGAQSQALRLTFLIRLIPVNAAFVSYLLGAAHFPWRAVLLGNLGLFPHMFLIVYIGQAANHVTVMAAQKHAGWTLEDSMMIVGLVAAGILVGVLTRLANRAIADVEAASAIESRDSLAVEP